MLSFGLTIPFFTYELAEADAIQAEHDGFDSVWITDHMINPMKIGGQDAWDQIEAWTAMSGIAARTERVRLGLPDPGSRERLLDHALPAVRRASQAWSS